MRHLNPRSASGPAGHDRSPRQRLAPTSVKVGRLAPRSASRSLGPADRSAPRIRSSTRASVHDTPVRQPARSSVWGLNARGRSRIKG